MKTVQETLRVLDEDKLIDSYLNSDIIVKELFRKSDTNYSEIKNILKEYITNLKDITLMEEINKGVVYLFKYYNIETGMKLYLDFIELDRILKSSGFKPKIDVNKIKEYSFEDIMNFYIADNKLTQDNLYTLVIQMLHLMLYKPDIDMSLEYQTDYKFQLYNDDYEKHISKKILNCTYDLNIYSTEKELREIIKLIEPKNKDDSNE